MVSILSVAGYVMRANGGCQTPCLVISACTVAETALASTPPLSLLPHVRGNSMAHMPEARCTYASLLCNAPPKLLQALARRPMPLFGSAKKVVPVDGKAAGDADAAAQQPAAEDSITFDTFKATVDGSALAKDDFWNEARLKQAFQLLDINGNGRLTRGEFQQGMSHVRGLFAELEEPPEAVVAGVVAVGSRVHKGTYEQPMKEWAERADALLPKQVMLNTSTAAVQAIAPRYLAVLKERK